MFGQNRQEILILVKIFKKPDFGQKFWKISIISKNFRKISNLVKIFETNDGGQNFSIFVQISEILEFCHNFRKISIVVKIFTK